MRPRLIPGLTLAVVLSVVAGCGGGGGAPPAVSASQLPLVPGVRIAARVTQCDRGANAFCAVELLVVDRDFTSSGALMTREHQLLRQRGWSTGVGYTGDEQAADSPGHKLQVTYATALGDLTGVDLKWIKRPHAFAVALARAVFSRRPAMSLMLARGPA